MINLTSIARLSGALFVLAAATAVGTVPGHTASGVALQCSADGAGDISMTARYEERARTSRTRKKFSAEFEAAPRGNFRAGQVMTVIVKGVAVGNVPLKMKLGDLVGDLNLDTSADSPGERPFPANFPQVERNTNVAVKINGGIVLGCRLQ
jgi:hypothetical protein